MRAVHCSCRWYQPRGVSRVLPWGAAWGGLGSPMVVGVRGGARGQGGSGRGALSRCAASLLMCVCSSVGPAGGSVAGWSRGREAGSPGCLLHACGARALL